MLKMSQTECKKVASDERSAMGSLPFLVGSVPAD